MRVPCEPAAPMGKGTFRALVVIAVMVPLVVIGLLFAIPASREAIASFFRPLPEGKRDGGVAALPALASQLGGESNELRTLREDAASHAAALAVARPRTALFAFEGDEIPKVVGTQRQGIRRPEILLRDDASVDRAVAFLTSDTRTRERFVDAWKRSGRFAIDLGRILRAWKAPEALLAVSFVESAFQPTLATGDAVGAWQLGPDIAHVYGLAMLPEYDERRAITNSTEASARYLSDLRERFGSWELAIAAFALGYGPTLDIVTKAKSSDFWTLASAFPRPVKTYVAEVMATATVLGNLSVFGLDTVKRAESASLSDLDVPPGTTFALAARAAGIGPAALHELNPEYKGETVPRTSFAMMLHIPGGTLARARELLPRLQAGDEIPDEGDAGPAPAASSNAVVSRGTEKRIFYKTREGDTLASLAKEHHTTVEQIASDNALDATSSLRPMTILAIRVGEEAPADAGTPSPSPSPRQKR